MLKKAIFLLAVLLMGCSEKRPHSINFYIWKSTPDLTQNEKEIFQELRSEKIYLRFFDIDLNGAKPQPEGILNNFSPEFLKADYIPVVFITNRVFKNLSTSESKKLVKNTTELIQEIADKHKLKFSEIQIDCDWTASTRATYFAFLSELKKETAKQITCTLRLHQVKYKDKTGVPPVEKVYLMCYATANPITNTEGNSILDLPILRDYLGTINEYPLAFDIDLALYSWGIVTNHVGKVKLINGISPEEVTTDDFKKVSKNTYEVLDDVFLHGVYLNKGFTLKIERISPEILSETKTYLNNKIDRPYAIVYFHLDRLFTDQFTINDLL